jgi:predicted nucleic acid-binding protein
LAVALGLQGILLDDRKARTLARREGLLVVGTLGVLEAAAERALIALGLEVEKLVRETNYRVDEKLIHALLARHPEP